MLKFGGGFILGFVAGFAALFILVMINGDYDDTAPPTSIVVASTAVVSEPQATATIMASSTLAPTPIVYVGDTVQQDGYSLAVLAIEDPATRPGVFYEPVAGQKLVAIEFAVGNVANEIFSSNELYAVLIDEDGYLYRAANTMVEDSIELLDVAPGQNVRGWASFLLPSNAVPRSFKYEYGRSGIVIQIDLNRR